MDNLNLILKFKVAGDANLHVKGAARIKVDGRGGLMLYDAQGGPAEMISLHSLQSFCIQLMNPSCAYVPALVMV